MLSSLGCSRHHGNAETVKKQVAAANRTTNLTVTFKHTTNRTINPFSHASYISMFISELLSFKLTSLIQTIQTLIRGRNK